MILRTTSGILTLPLSNSQERPTDFVLKGTCLGLEPGLAGGVWIKLSGTHSLRPTERIRFPMDRLGPYRAESFLQRIPRRVWHIASTVLAVTSVLLFVAALLANLQRSYMVLLLSVGFAAAAFALVFLLTGLSRQLHREQQETTSVLQTTKHELQQMADNIRKSSGRSTPRQRTQST